MNEDWRNELVTKGAAFDALTEIENQYEFEDGHDHLMRWAKTKIFALPPEQPEIIRCKDCMHNGSFDTDCPIDWNGKEYCNFAERKDDE